MPRWTTRRRVCAGLLSAALVVSAMSLASCSRRTATPPSKESTNSRQAPSTDLAALALQDLALGLMSNGTMAEVRSDISRQSGVVGVTVRSVDATTRVTEVDSVAFSAGSAGDSPYEIANASERVEQVSASPEFVAVLWGVEGEGLGRSDTASYVTASWDEFAALYKKTPSLRAQLESTGAFLVVRDGQASSLIQVYAP